MNDYIFPRSRASKPASELKDMDRVDLFEEGWKVCVAGNGIGMAQYRRNRMDSASQAGLDVGVGLIDDMAIRL